MTTNVKELVIELLSSERGIEVVNGKATDGEQTIIIVSRPKSQAVRPVGVAAGQFQGSTASVSRAKAQSIRPVGVSAGQYQSTQIASAVRPVGVSAGQYQKKTVSVSDAFRAGMNWRLAMPM